MSSNAISRASVRSRFARPRNSSRSPSGFAWAFAPDIPMTGRALSLPRLSAPRRHPALARQAPVLAVLIPLIASWYVAAVLMNIGLVRDAFEREEAPYAIGDLISASLAAERPRLPAPHQIAAAFADGMFGYPVTSGRSLVFHSAVTLLATVVGFLLGALFGVILATLIVHLPTLQKSLMPWIIC